MACQCGGGPKEGMEIESMRDYTYLNEVCPKDIFPLPRINKIIDALSRQGMLSFLDAFSDYHQIPMHPPDAKKTAFIIPHRLYCYKLIPFGLKNAGATYQRLVKDISTIDGQDHGSLYRRYSCQI